MGQGEERRRIEERDKGERKVGERGAPAVEGDGSDAGSTTAGEGRIEDGSGGGSTTIAMAAQRRQGRGGSTMVAMEARRR
jgi:hypothetical protein